MRNFKKGDHWRLVNKVPIRTKRGEIVGLVGISRDIQALKTAETELRDRTSMLEGILDNVPQRIFWKGKTLEYEGCNRSFQRYHGLANPNDVIGKTDFDLSTHGEATAFQIDDRAVIESGNPRLYYLENQKDNRIILRTSKLPRRDASGTVIGVLGISEDVTIERKREERRLRMEMASRIGHCLKGRVLVLESNLSSLKAALGGGLDEVLAFERATNFFKRATLTASNIFRLNDELRPERLEIRPLVGELIALLRDSRIRLDPVPKSARINGNAFHIRNALLELLQNACEFAPVADKGDIHVFVECSGAPKARCLIHVADNGRGVPAHIKEGEFTVFGGLDPGRTGVGLPYVADVARLHQGAVREISTAGEGAHFVLDFPLVA